MDQRRRRERGGMHEWPVSLEDWLGGLLFKNCLTDGEALVVRAKLPAEAGTVSLVRDNAPCAADQAYSACRSGSA